MTGRKYILPVMALLLVTNAVRAQVPAGYVLADSLVFTRLSSVDTTLAGKSIFSILPEGIRVYQSDAVREAVNGRVAANETENFQGYRIRIYFDNSQNARGASSSILYGFRVKHPEIPAYRTFDSPNFKVTVGDFRTRSEALSVLKSIQAEYPSAFIVREKFKYPAMSGGDDFRVDTLKVLRRL